MPSRYLYAVTVVRLKSEYPAGPKDHYCVVVPQPSWQPSYPPSSADGIGLNYPLMIGYRAYLNPHTGSGPSYRDIIPDRSILFPSP